MESPGALQAVVALCALIAAPVSFALERRRRATSPGTLPYTWGFFQGVGSLLAGSWIFLLTLGAGGDAIAAGLVVVALYAVPGWFVIRRRRWAWVVLTIATLNPVLWIAHYVYGKNRWSEFNARSTGSIEPAGTGSGARFSLNRLRSRIREWHGGKIVLLWLAAAILFFFLQLALDPYGNDVGAVLFLWIVMIAPLFWATWLWFDGKEARNRRHD